MKKIICILLLVVMSFSFVSVYANDIEKQAKALYDLGLLKGTSAEFSMEALELDRYANRAEVCTTIVRMLGKEEKAHYQANLHPFSDVPAWAGNYVGWLYENYLVNGMSETYFGAQDYATVGQFSTMLLRVLGYDDAQGDFYYNSASEFACQNGIFSGASTSDSYLTRREMITLCYQALLQNIKNSARPLIRKLCEEGAVSETLAESTGIFKNKTISDFFADVEENLGTIDAKIKGDRIVITLNNEAEHYGLRIFMKEKGKGAVQEIGKGGAGYFTKGKIEYYGGSAGYVSELYIGGIDFSKSYEFIVLKTSSEGDIYFVSGKSAGVLFN